MKKMLQLLACILLQILFYSGVSKAQISFEPFPVAPPNYAPAPPFDGVRNGSVAFSDVDGDGDEDVLITGTNASNVGIAKLYSNDGLGNFSLVSGTPFDGVQSSSVTFSDIDGDGDEDVLITGVNSSNIRIAKLYTNDGLGNFVLVSGTPFDGVNLSSVAFSDIDGDGDEDVLITGMNASNIRIAKLYSNDGLGNFSLVSGTPFDGVYFSSIAFSDVDGDGDEDVLITGLNASNVRIAKLYSNNGLGNFSLVSGTPFDGIWSSSIAFSDVDGDGDEDVLITGENASNVRIAKLYSNDGLGNFSLVSGTPFEGVSGGSIAFSDVDGDGDKDVLITGYSASNVRIAKLYSNNGLGSFSLVSGTPFDGVNSSSVAFSDVDGDGDEDVLITGLSASNIIITKLYLNNGLGNFVLVSGTPFDGVYLSSVAFSDVDGDGDEDVLITGSSSIGRIAKLYTNDGLGNFTLVTGTPFDGVRFSSIAFSDVDVDGDEDVLITGQNASNVRIAKLYGNDGLGNFVLLSGTPFDGVYYSSVTFSDVDGDGDEDVLITGMNASNVRIAKLFRNNGLGNFSLVSGTPFDGVQNSSVAFSDVDGDGDEDVLITGSSSIGYIAKLYRNNGLGSFSLVSGTPFDGVQNSSVAFSDVDGDGDEDVLITGLSTSNVRIAKLYSNDGLGNFSLVSGTPFDGVWSSSVAFSDVDGDGDEDVLITGQNASNVRISKLYSNDGLGNFSLESGTPFDGVSNSSVAFSDVDGDGNEDVLITGLNASNQPIAKGWLNTSFNFALPVKWTHFNADRMRPDQVFLDWGTASEVNNQYFEVERMLDKESNFYSVTKIEGKGNSTSSALYEFIDQNSFSGTSYYRLKQIDEDGTVEYSEIKAVAGWQNDTKVELYPNPVKTSFQLRIHGLSDHDRNVQIQILDSKGMLIQAYSSLIMNDQVLSIRGLDTLSRGIYAIKVMMSSGNSYQYKFVKE